MLDTRETKTLFLPLRSSQSWEVDSQPIIIVRGISVISTEGYGGIEDVLIDYYVMMPTRQ